MPAIAAIDIGSNAMRLLIGEVNEQGQIGSVENFREAVRLGQDVFSEGAIKEDTTLRAVEALNRFRKAMERQGVTRYRAVATSAMREATNAASFVDRISKDCGINLEVIGAEEEARLVFMAVASKVTFPKNYTLLIDIGGGSVEVSLVFEGQVVKSESYQLGTVRLIELFAARKRGERAFVRMVEKYVRGIRRELKRELGEFKISLCVATGGNVEALGNLRVSCLGRSRNNLLKAKELESLTEVLSSMDLAQRIKELDLRPDRADVILPAALVLFQVVKEIELKEIVIPQVGLKDGVLLDCLASDAAPSLPARRKELRNYARALGRKYRYDRAHAEVVSSMAVSIFDQTRQLHKLGDDSRLLLEIACILHDIGHFISVNGHHKHSHYLISSSPFVGLSAREKSIVAATARYHRKALPSEEHSEFAALNPGDRQIVLQLAAILRIADAIDRDHAGASPRISCELKGTDMRVTVGENWDAPLERWAVIDKGRLFEQVFNCKLSVQ